MRKSSTAVALLTLVALCIGGCAMAGKGTSVMKYTKGTEAHMGEAPSDGTYALYGLTDATPKISYSLKQGDKLGFMVSNGQVQAMAGSHMDTYPDGTYYWKKQ